MAPTSPTGSSDKSRKMSLRRRRKGKRDRERSACGKREAMTLVEKDKKGDPCEKLHGVEIESPIRFVQRKKIVELLLCFAKKPE